MGRGIAALIIAAALSGLLFAKWHLIPDDFVPWAWGFPFGAIGMAMIILTVLYRKGRFEYPWEDSCLSGCAELLGLIFLPLVLYLLPAKIREGILGAGVGFFVITLIDMLSFYAFRWWTKLSKM